MPDLKLDADDFALLGLPRRFALDRALIDAQGRSLQAQVHPDRFAAQGAAAQRVAMQWSVRVNEAWQRLKNPLQRASLLCELAGVRVGDDSRSPMPPEFLLQQMVWREALGDADSPEAVRAVDREVHAAESDLMDSLQRQIDEDQAWDGAARSLQALMFLARVRQDIDRRLEAMET